MMIYGKSYRVTKRIKLHTSPLRKAEVVQEGKFLGETEKSYLFDGFRVSKETFLRAEEIGG